MPEHPEPSERWALIERLFHAAMEKPPEERAAFLSAACGSDAGLRGEVESLLGQAGAADSLLEHPPLTRAGLQAPEYGAGTMIGPYRIVEPLGAGGMGEVYRAHDPRMGRDVAIKLTGERFSDRFASEVRAVAALNHSNICHIYDVGPNYLVMELCEGETLAARLKRGRLSVPEAVEYGVQMADALSAAHAKGIVHRDLKPANVMLTQGGVKLLDFGLAKRFDPPAAEDAPTIPPRVQTEAGTILGTAAYMSPEQAEGKPIDARTDVFSFGAVLYEMVTGERAFQGESSLSTLSAVLNKEPVPIDAAIPPDLRKLIGRCLRKSTAGRLQHMGDIRVLLEELRDDSRPDPVEGPPPAAPEQPRRRLWWPALVALPLLTLAGAFLYSRLVSKPDATPKVVHLTNYPGMESSPSFSPDGTQVAFSWSGERQDNLDIYVKLVSGGPPLRLTRDAQQDHSPAWSPDGSQIAFIRGGFIYLISPLGGPERKLTQASASLSWSPDGKILAFSDEDPDSSIRSIYMVSVATGERRRVSWPKAGDYGDDVRCAISPDGRSLAFIRQLLGMGAIYLLPLKDGAPSGEARRLTRERLNAAATVAAGLDWTPDSRELLYASNRGGRTAVWRLAVSGEGEPRRVPGAEEAVLLSVSRGVSPRLAFARFDVRWNIWQADLPTSGTLTTSPWPILVSTGIQTDPQFSPDGKRIAFKSDRSDNPEIWVAESTGANPVQLTNFAGARTAGGPRWSPDGNRIAFDSTDGAHWDIFVIDAGGGASRRLTDGSSSFVRPSWSRDGRWIYFGSRPSPSAGQIWKMPADGGKAVQVTRGGGREAVESFDGKTLYFAKGPTRPGILSMPTQGGPESLLIPAGRAGYWAVAENGILFLDFEAREGKGPTPLKFYRFKTRQTAELGLLDKITLTRLNTLSVTRDGRHAIWCQMDSAESDLMLVENFR